MSKITERSLKDACMAANQGVMKTWSFGLVVERFGTGFLVYKRFRRPGQGANEALFSVPVPAKSASCFIEGFLTAAALANSKEGKETSTSNYDPESM